MKNLNYVASLVQMDMEDFTTHKRLKIIQYCIDCYKEVLRYKTDRSVEVAYLQPNDAMNAPWPSDYEYYTKVGINVGGQLVTLTLNNDIPLVRKYECGSEVADTSQVNLGVIDPSVFTGGWGYAPHYRAGQFVGEMYSLGGGFNELGYFRVDHKMRQFQFSGVPQTEIVMEYVADSKTNGSTLIQYSDVPVIRAYVHWKLMEHDKKVPVYEKDRKFGLFNAALVRRSDIEFIPTLSDYMDNCWKSVKSTVKR